MQWRDRSPNNGSAIVAVCHPARQGIQRTVPTEATAPRARRAAAAANKRHVRLKAQRRLAQTSPRSAAAAAHAAANSLNNPVDGFARMPKMSSGRPSEKSASTSPHMRSSAAMVLTAAIRRTGSLHNSPAKAAVAKLAASTAAAAKNARLHPVPMVHSVLIRASSVGCSANLPFSCAGCSVPSDDCPSPAVNVRFRGPQPRLL